MTRTGAIAGAILAGGQSSRMGQNKALLPVRGVPMIQHIAAAMQSVVPSLCIVSDSAEPYRFLHLPVIADVVNDAGPMGGIHAALTRLGATSVLVSGCDTPFLTPPLFQHLLSIPSSAPALVARAEGRLHPLCGIYRREALPLIEASLAAGHFALLDLLQKLGADIVPVTTDLPFYRQDLFTNVNTADDLRRAGEGSGA